MAIKPSDERVKNPITQRVLMWNISSPLADSLFSWSNVVLIIGAALVFIGTIGSIKMAAIREHFADIRISDNERATKGAIAESDVAKADAAKANERAAELEREAAKSREEAERLKGVVQWRAIPATNASELERLLAAKPGAVNLRWTDGDPEALFVAIQFSQIFSKAGWQVAPGSLKPLGQLFFGIVLLDSSGAAADELRDALTKAGIPVGTGNIQGGSASFGVATINGAPTLLIGSRPPPQLP